MEAADLLCDSLFLWMKNRKECAEELRVLAEAATPVLSKTGVVTRPMVPISVTATGGTADCGTSPLVEEGMSSSTFNKATELIEEDEKVGTSIKKHLQDLKDQCGGAQLGDHADELDCEVTSLLMCALARRDNTHVTLDFLRAFNRATVFRHMTPGGLDPVEAESFICRALGLDRVPVIKSSLKVLDAIGLDRPLSNLIVTCEEMVKRNRVTEASKFLWDSARDILEGQQELQEQLDEMHKIIQKLFQMKHLMKNLGGYSLRINQDYCNEISGDNTVDPRTEEEAHGNEFTDLQFSLGRLIRILPDSRTPDGSHIHIVIVAHGRIDDRFMPAGVLVPTDNITDTILYSPWNCSIDPRAAFAIAQGNIQVTDREFQNMANCEPDPLPQRWNSMRGSHHDIPEILLSPLTPEEAWIGFEWFFRDIGIEIEDRIIIFPYLDPQDQVNASEDLIPLSIFISKISDILLAQGKTATVHLAANLTRRAGSPLMPEEWGRQYAYTSDGTVMTVNMDDRNMNSLLLAIFRSVFDKNRR